MLNKKIGVIGAGMMGADIALNFAIDGYDVILSDISLEKADQGKATFDSTLDRLVKRKVVESSQKQGIINRVKTTGDLNDFADRDLVIEVIIEIKEVKQELFAKLDKICRPDCIFATNTSSIPITNLASVVTPERAKRFIGLHFFSPVTIMELVEMIPSFTCDETVVETCKEYVRSIRKTPIVVKDSTGFAVNRILHTILMEGLRLESEGVATPADIDAAVKLGLNHKIGPFELMDFFSVDLTYLIQHILFAEFGERYRPQPLLRKMIASNKLGRKTGEGFYKYSKK